MHPIDKQIKALRVLKAQRLQMERKGLLKPVEGLDTGTPRYQFIISMLRTGPKTRTELETKYK